MIASAEDLDDSKENIKPLKRGRIVLQLKMALEAQTDPAVYQELLEQQRLLIVPSKRRKQQPSVLIKYLRYRGTADQMGQAEHNRVQSALPAIDVGPPPSRGHVCYKLKKLQWEEERCAQIEEDNFRLLQRMGSIMQTNRLDNHWLSQQPNFLHRVGIYKSRSAQSPATESPLTITPEEPSSRKVRCLACNPHRIKLTQVIPEERIPWEPPKRNVSRLLSGSTTNTQSTFTSSSHRSHLKDVDIVPHRLTLTRGGLHLQVNFPSQTGVRIRNGQQERLLQREYCQCKAKPGQLI